LAGGPKRGGCEIGFAPAGWMGRDRIGVASLRAEWVRFSTRRHKGTSRATCCSRGWSLCGFGGLCCKLRRSPVYRLPVRFQKNPEVGRAGTIRCSRVCSTLALTYRAVALVRVPSRERRFTRGNSRPRRLGRSDFATRDPTPTPRLVSRERNGTRSIARYAAGRRRVQGLYIPDAAKNERSVWHALTNGKGVVDRRSASPFAKPQGRATHPATSRPQRSRFRPREV
jgi:hypothetical protein